MKIYKNFEQIEGQYTACIGFFDGVHRGHRYLLQHLQQEAKDHHTLSAVVTFANHPRRLVQPDFPLLLVDTLDERLQKLSDTGIDACFLLDFTEEIRQHTAEQFIHNVLSQQMHITRLLIGYDHRFGRNRSEGFEDYVRFGAACGMTVVQEPVFNDGSGINYSSSEVRRALVAGDIQKATTLLGSHYRLQGEVVHGHKLGRQLGFPTANIDPHNDDKIRPENGVYAGIATLADGHSFPTMINIGCRPTVDNTQKITFEAHLIGFKGDLYGQRLTLDFVERIRDERKMNSLEDLKKQLARDCKSVPVIIRSREGSHIWRGTTADADLTLDTLLK